MSEFDLKKRPKVIDGFDYSLLYPLGYVYHIVEGAWYKAKTGTAVFAARQPYIGQVGMGYNRDQTSYEADVAELREKGYLKE